MFGLGPAELIIIAIIVLLIFGAKRLPEIGKGMAIKEFKKVKKELTAEDTDEQPQHADKSLEEEAEPAALEDKVVDKVLEQVPGVKQAMDVKKKAEKIKKIID